MNSMTAEQTSLTLYQSMQGAVEAAGVSEYAASQEGVETFNRATDAYNRRDVEALLETLDPEVEWYSALMVPLGGEATAFRGHDGIRELFRDLDEVLDDWHAEYPQIRDLGDRIIGIGRVRTRGRGSGAKTASPIVTLCDVRNGKAIRIRTYLDPDEALEAAGLSE
jgi:ketosteroid isomerase-like protein